MNPIIVATDFSDAAVRAGEFACEISKIYNVEILLLHIVSAPKARTLKNKGIDIAYLENKLQSTADKLSETFSINVKWTLRHGSIFSAINNTAEELQSPLVILGNHGATNFYQHFFKPYALRLASSSSTNYLLVKEHSKPRPFKEIILPVTDSLNQRNKLNQAMQLATFYKCAIHLLFQYYNDEKKFQQVLENMNDFRDEINAKGLTLFKMPQPKDMRLDDFIINYAEECEADLIIVDTGNDSEDIHAENIINNSKNIPVFCVPQN